MNQNHADFLKNHSLNYIEMALRTDNIERITNPDGYGKKTGDCGDIVEFFLCCHRKTIKSVSFYVQGCMNTNACCNTIATLVQGKTIEKAWEIDPETVIEYLETLPRDHFHCAELTVGAFYLAMADLNVERLQWRT